MSRSLVPARRSAITRWIASLSAGVLAVAFVSAGAGCGTTSAAEQRRQQFDYHYQLATGYWADNQTPQALAELLTAMEFIPDDPDALHLWGFIYMGRRDYPEAETYFRRALEEAPERWDILNNLGTVMLATERWTEAEEIYRQLTRQPTYGTPAHAYNNLGWAMYNLGDYRGALSNFELATEFEPSMCLAWNNLGLSWQQLGDLREAERAWDRVTGLTVCDTFAEPRYHLALLLLNAQGDPARIQELFEECQQMDRAGTIGRSCEEYLNALGMAP
jgi:Tfp pilus assembly protein PilF